MQPALWAGSVLPRGTWDPRSGEGPRPAGWPSYQPEATPLGAALSEWLKQHALKLTFQSLAAPDTLHCLTCSCHTAAVDASHLVFLTLL